MIFDLLNELKVVSASAIVGKALAKEFLDKVYKEGKHLSFSTYDEALKIIEAEEFLIVSVFNWDGETEYFLQELLNKNGEQFFMDDDIVFIEDNLVDVYDKDRIEGFVVFLKELVEEIPEKTVTFYDVIDDMVDHLMEVISKEKCPRCLKAEIEEALISAYEYGIE